MVPKKLAEEFAQNLLLWYEEFGRELPWRQTADPYKILVSEFMLQQTQVFRVLPKYEQFLAVFPTLSDLAEAPLSQVLELWSGLGYNRRAKFLQMAAKDIVKDHHGAIPHTENALLQIHGIGPYTANAILAFAFNKPVIVIDANVKNVFNRVFGLTEKEIPEAISRCLPKHHARDFYNALMDIGSTYYKSTSDYSNYPFKDFCKWYLGEEIPKIKKYKQATFIGSNRWYRGQILKGLTQNKTLLIDFFDVRDDSEKYFAALDQLESEGMVVRESGKVYLAK